MFLSVVPEVFPSGTDVAGSGKVREMAEVWRPIVGAGYQPSCTVLVIITTKILITFCSGLAAMGARHESQLCQLKSSRSFCSIRSGIDTVTSIWRSRLNFLYIETADALVDAMMLEGSLVVIGGC